MIFLRGSMNEVSPSFDVAKKGLVTVGGKAKRETHRFHGDSGIWQDHSNEASGE
jgi:hypothetical protein